MHKSLKDISAIIIARRALRNKLTNSCAPNVVIAESNAQCAFVSCATNTQSNFVVNCETIDARPISPIAPILGLGQGQIASFRHTPEQYANRIARGLRQPCMAVNSAKQRKQYKQKRHAMGAGRYSDALNKGSLAATYNKHLLDPEFKNLQDEIAISRSFVEAALETLNGKNLNDLSPTAQTIVVQMIAEVRASVEAMARVDQKLSVNLTVTDVHAVVEQIFGVIQRHVVDPITLSRIAREIKSLVIDDSGPSSPREARALAART